MKKHAVKINVQNEVKPKDPKKHYQLSTTLFCAEMLRKDKTSSSAETPLKG